MSLSTASLPRPTKIRRKKSLSGLVFQALIGMSVVAVFILGGVQTLFELNRFHTESNLSAYDTQKRAQDYNEAQLKQVRNFLDSRIYLAEQELDQTLKSRVSDAIAQALEILDGQTDLSLNDQKKLIIDALSPIRFNSGRSYFIILDSEGMVHLFPPNREAEGKHYSRYAEATPAMPHLKVIARAASASEGFFTHPLYIDNEGQPFHQRRWYYQTLPRLGWIILAHESIDLFTENLQRQLVKEVELFTQQPYFEFTLFDAKDEPIGGTRTESISSSSLEFSRAISLPLSHWQWRVESEAPLEQTERLMINQQNEINDQIEHRLLILSALVLLFVIIAALISRTVERKLRRQLAHFIKDLKLFALDNEPIGLHQLKYREFSELAETANKFTAQRALMVKELERQSQRDPLTDLYNRRYMSELLILEEARINRNCRHFAIILADIDHFKQINDLYGHEAGDLAIKRIGHALRHAIRKQDQVCRWGGEEFLIMLPDASLESAYRVAEKIQQAVAELSIIFRGKRIYCTVTMGIAVHTNEHDLPKTIDQADKAMYQGKREGRNRIVTTSSIELAEPTYA